MRIILAGMACAVSMIGTTLAAEVEFPSRKSGMWEIRMVTEGGGAPEMSIKACIDEATDRQMMEAGFSMSKSMCPEQSIARDGDAYVIDSTCQIGPMSTRSHIVVTGDFQSSYQVKMTSETSGGMPGMAGTTDMTQTATWTGDACTDGLTPGDMLMPGGMKMNVNDMMKMMGGS